MTTQILDANWSADASGNWTDGGNWSTQVIVIVNGNPTIQTVAEEPVGANYDVSLSPAGSTPFTVTYDTTDTINALAASGLATLDVTGGTLTMVSSASFGGAVSIQAGLVDAQSGWTVSGGFDLSSGATIEVDSGVLAVSSGTLSGSVTGAGSLYVLGGSGVTLGSGFSSTAADLEIGVNGDGFGATITLAGNVSYTGDFAIDNYSGNNGTLALNGHTATIGGTERLDGQVDGPGTLAVSGTITVSSGGYTDFGILDGAVLQDRGTLTEIQGVNLGGTIDVVAGASWSIASDNSISGGGVLINAGSFSKTGGTAISYVAAGVTNSGNFTAATGTLAVQGSFSNSGTIGGTAVIVDGAFTGATSGHIDATLLELEGGGTLAGNLAGAGAIELTNGAAYTLHKNTTLALGTLGIYGNATLSLQSAESFKGDLILSDASVALGTHSLTLAGTASLEGDITGSGALSTANATIANLTVAGSIDWLDNGTVTQTADCQLGGGAADTVSLSIGKAAQYDIAGAFWLGNPNINDTGTGTIVNTGLFEMTGANGYATVFNADFNSTGTIAVTSGLSLQNGTATLGGTISGAGSLYLADDWTLSAGAKLKIARIENNGAGTLAAATAYGGLFVQDGGGTIDLAGQSLSLTGADTLSGDIGNGGTLILGNATLNNFTAFSSTTVVDAGMISQTGSTSLGDFSTDAVNLIIHAGATYGVTGNQWLGNPNQGDTGVATISNAGLFTTAAGNAVDVWHSNFTNTGTLLANGAISLIGNSASLGGTLAGAGALTLQTSWTLQSTATVTVAQLINSGAGTLSTAVSYGGSFTNAGGATLDLAGNTLSLTGPASLSGTIGGTGTLALGNATENSFFIAGNTTEEITGSASLQNGGQLGDGSTDAATLSILKDASFTLNGSQWLGNPNVNDTGIATIVNAGSFVQAEGGTGDVWHANFINTGTLTSNGTLALLYQFATLGGTINGSGQVSLDENFSLAGGTSLRVALFENAASGTLLGSVTDAGAWQNDSGAALALSGHTLTLAAGGSLSGTISGAGLLAVTAGTVTLSAGGTLTAASLDLGPGATLALAESTAFAGSFNSAGRSGTASLTLAGNTLTLSGTTTLGSAGTFAVSGAGGLTLGGTATLDHVTADAGAALTVTGSTSQGGAVTLGDAAGTASLAIASSGIWDITANGGITGTGASTITNAGLFEKTKGTGASTISAAFSNTGTLEVTSGSLVFTGGFINSGTIIGTETSANGTVTITASALLPADFGLHAALPATALPAPKLASHAAALEAPPTLALAGLFGHHS